jgi:hypothetical protein
MALRQKVEDAGQKDGKLMDQQKDIGPKRGDER